MYQDVDIAPAVDFRRLEEVIVITGTGMNTLIAIAGILVAVALQARMPTLWWLGGVHVELLPCLSSTLR